MSRPTKSELDRFFSRKPDLPGRYGTASELSRMFPSGFESEVEDEVEVQGPTSSKERELLEGGPSGELVLPPSPMAEADPWPIAEAVETGLHPQGLS